MIAAPNGVGIHDAKQQTLTPPTTVLWAWLLLDQSPAPLAIPGVVVCAAGVTARAAATVHTTAATQPQCGHNCRTKTHSVLKLGFRR
jgi:hypothetical protein